MDLISVEKISFSGFVKICVMIFLAGGCTFAFVLFVLSLFGAASATITTDSSEITGLTGVLISNLVIIVTFLGLGVMTGLAAYFPFLKTVNLLQKQD